MSEHNPFTSGADPTARDEAAPDTATPVEMDVGPILSRCWELVTSYPGLVLGAALIPLVPGIGVGIVDAAITIAADSGSVDEGTAVALEFFNVALQLANGVLGIFLQIGIARIFLNLARGGTANLGMLVSGGPLFLSALGASILSFMAIFVGFLLLIVPGIVLATGLQFYMYALVDQRLGAVEAMQESWRLTDGYKMTVFLINLVIGILAVLFTCLTLGFGYLLMLPMLSLAQAVMYHSLTHLQGRAGAVTA